MNSKRLMNAIGGIEDKYIEAAESTPQATYAAVSSKKPFRVWKFSPIAASLVIVVALAAIFGSNPSWFNHSGNYGVVVAPDETANNPAVQTPITDNGYQADSSIRGLPVENFNLADVQNGGVSMDRMVFPDFGSLFQWGVDSIAFVKVESTQTVKGSDGSSFDRQISNVRILKSVYGDCKSDTLQISQSVIQDHFCLGTTNLLREGAVYLLPLKQSDDDWYVIGDMDVLFEVDDKGRVWSHSAYEDFNQYDGQDVDRFIGELQTLISNDDFLLANSPFSSTLQSWTLADINVTDKSGALSDEYGEYYNYSFSVNEVLSVPTNPNSDRLGAMGNIMVYADDAAIKLTPGSRYLLCLDCFEGIINANARMIAEIKNDGAIKVIPADDNNSRLGFSVFTPYDGYTVDEIKDLISRIDFWQESNS